MKAIESLLLYHETRHSVGALKLAFADSSSPDASIDMNKTNAPAVTRRCKLAI